MHGATIKKYVYIIENQQLQVSVSNSAIIRLYNIFKKCAISNVHYVSLRILYRVMTTWLQTEICSCDFCIINSLYMVLEAWLSVLLTVST